MQRREQDDGKNSRREREEKRWNGRENLKYLKSKYFFGLLYLWILIAMIYIFSNFNFWVNLLVK